MRRKPRIVGGRVLPGEFQLDVLVDDLESRLTPRVPRVGEQQFVDLRAESMPDTMLKDERGARVRAAIAQLPPKQRSTLILRMYHEMSHQEIADALGSSVGAVKANFFHALGNLKKLLEHE